VWNATDAYLDHGVNGCDDRPLVVERGRPLSEHMHHNLRCARARACQGYAPNTGNPTVSCYRGLFRSCRESLSRSSPLVDRGGPLRDGRRRELDAAACMSCPYTSLKHCKSAAKCPTTNQFAHAPRFALNACLGGAGSRSRCTEHEPEVGVQFSSSYALVSWTISLILPAGSHQHGHQGRVFFELD